ncbi:MAG: glucose-1-phosphate cytidylyltransferase [Bacteroidia bacterium]
MKVLILAGGFGTRLAEETDIRPKPMAEIGGRPILWHIMKTYSYYGFNEFVILLGYKGHYIKDYFANYYLQQCDVTFDLANNAMEVHDNFVDPWKVTLLDTGLHTMTAGRIKRAAKYIGNEPFMLTYGDGVANVNIHDLLSFHESHKGALTMTSVKVSGRFGSVYASEDHKVANFKEKPKGDENWINGGFFVCNPEVLDYIPEGVDGDKLMFEHNPLENMTADGQVYTYRHTGFWQCMDTLADKNKLNKLWNEGQAEWFLQDRPVYNQST